MITSGVQMNQICVAPTPETYRLSADQIGGSGAVSLCESMTRCEWPLIAGAARSHGGCTGSRKRFSGSARLAVCSPDHPLAELIAAAAAGRFPAADGGWRRVPPWRPGLEAIIAFTGHAVFAVQPDITGHLLASLGADGFGGAHDPRLITALAGPGGWIDSLDILMAARGTARPGVTPALADRPDLAGHPRAEFAAGIRDHPRVVGYQDPRRSALAVISTGIAGLTELSFELEPGHRGAGGGARLASEVLSTVPSGQIAVAAVAPGNAASVRALLAAGFKPLGSLQLFRRAGHNPGTRVAARTRAKMP